MVTGLRLHIYCISHGGWSRILPMSSCDVASIGLFLGITVLYTDRVPISAGYQGSDHLSSRQGSWLIDLPAIFHCNFHLLSRFDVHVCVYVYVCAPIVRRFPQFFLYSFTYTSQNKRFFKKNIVCWCAQLKQMPCPLETLQTPKQGGKCFYDLENQISGQKLQRLAFLFIGATTLRLFEGYNMAELIAQETRISRNKNKNRRFQQHSNVLLRRRNLSRIPTGTIQLFGWGGEWSRVRGMRPYAHPWRRGGTAAEAAALHCTALLLEKRSHECEQCYVPCQITTSTH